MILYANTLLADWKPEGIQLASKMALIQEWMYESWTDIFSSMSGLFSESSSRKTTPQTSETHVPVAARLPSMREKLLLTWERAIHHSSATEQTYVHKQAPSAVKRGTFNKLKNSSCSQQPRQIHLTQGARGICTSLMDRADGWSYRCYTFIRAKLPNPTYFRQNFRFCFITELKYFNLYIILNLLLYINYIKIGFMFMQ